MIKLQKAVPDHWQNLDRDLARAWLDHLPKEQQHNAPRSANTLIPLGLLLVAKSIGRDDLVTTELLAEAQEMTSDKPGRKRRTPAETLPLFDSALGQWLSVVALSTGTARVECGSHTLSLFGCRCLATASSKAVEEGWGAVPESRGELQGIRFLPPGASLQAQVPAPPPMAKAEIGAWISETAIKDACWTVLADGRKVKQTRAEQDTTIRTDALPTGALAVRQASYAPRDHAKDVPPEDQRKIDAEELAQAIREAFADCAAQAFENGWTARREIRGGHAGILLIPPSVGLSYEIAPGRKVPVSHVEQCPEESPQSSKEAE